MFAKTKNQQMPSDIQAKEKLAHYVYEYLMHLGAKQSAQTFLQEIRWDKNVSLGEAPGFLSSWWCVFWDLYCAAPERRNQYESTDEAKVFHDYSLNSQGPSANPMMMPGQPQFARFHPNSRGMRMPTNLDFNAVNNSTNANPANVNSSTTPTGNSTNPNPQMNIDPNRVTSGMSPMNRLTPPGARNIPISNQQSGSQQQNLNNINFNAQGQASNQQIRVSNTNNANQNLNNAPMSPMPMNMQQQQQHQARWSGSGQGSVSQSNQSQPQPQTPSSTFHEQNMNNMVPLNTEISHHTQINGEILDSIKNSPISNIPPRHHEEHSNTGAITDLNPYNNFGDANLF